MRGNRRAREILGVVRRSSASRRTREETMANPDARVTIHMVASLDGFIARKDGRVDWLETSDEFVGGGTMDPRAGPWHLVPVRTGRYLRIQNDSRAAQPAPAADTVRSAATSQVRYTFASRDILDA